MASRVRVLVGCGAATALLLLLALPVASATRSASAEAGLAAVGSGKGCTGEVAQQTVESFLAALSRHDASAADAMFAASPGFMWYSSTAPGARRNAAAKNRASLARYFKQRVQLGERMHLTETHKGQASAGSGYVNGRLLRSAADLKPTLFNFKAAVTCASGTPQIIVWSMARNTGGQ